MEGILHFIFLVLLVILPTAGLCLLYNKKQNLKTEPVQVPTGLISGYEEGVEEASAECQKKASGNELLDDLIVGPTPIGVDQDHPAPDKPLSTLLRELDDMMVDQNVGKNNILILRPPNKFETTSTLHRRNRFKGKDLTKMIPTYS